MKNPSKENLFSVITTRRFSLISRDFYLLFKYILIQHFINNYILLKNFRKLKKFFKMFEFKIKGLDIFMKNL